MVGPKGFKHHILSREPAASLSAVNRLDLSAVNRSDLSAVNRLDLPTKKGHYLPCHSHETLWNSNRLPPSLCIFFTPAQLLSPWLQFDLGRGKSPGKKTKGRKYTEPTPVDTVGSRLFPAIPLPPRGSDQRLVGASLSLLL